MIKNAISALQDLHLLAKCSHVRYPVILQGDDIFLLTLLNAIPDITLVSDILKFPRKMSWSQTTSLLGQDLASLALDIRTTIDVEKLCLISGCITGGELLLLLVPEKKSNLESLFRSRFNRFFYHKNASYISQSGEMYFSTQILPISNHHLCSESSFVTEDQKLAIDAIKRVLSGHRRRPALLVADRGRGKSSALGMAAAMIMSSLKKRILITSPLFINVDSLFVHALNCPQIIRESTFFLRGANGSELQFIAPDRLLDEKPVCDLLLVDEAAAIPLPMLTQILGQYSRIVFSSTEHGYEGSGRAFSLRFRSLLDQKAKGWKEIKLMQPVRWKVNDPLEKWLFDVFLFEAEPSTINGVVDLSFRQLHQQELFADENLLKQIFALLVAAHYQTSPNDLIMLLDGKLQVLFGAFYGKELVGILLAQHEGGFDKKMAMAVLAGKRRLKGHLLAQSIACHTGVVEALTSSLFRVVRVAVHPDCRNRGIGSALVRKMEAHAEQKGILFVGASFGVTKELWHFWSSLGYSSVRLGVKKDAASGTFSLQLLKSLAGMPDWFSDLLTLFPFNFTHQLSVLFQDMEIDIALRLLSQYQKINAPSKIAKHQVDLFSQGALGYDLVLGSLHAWFLHWLATNNEADTDSIGCHVLFARLLQAKSWVDLAVQFDFKGRKDIENAMRVWVKSVR